MPLRYYADMKKRVVSAIFLAAYIAVLIKVMVFKDLPLIQIGSLMLNFGGTDAGHAPNFVPFRTIVPYLFGYKGLIIAGINLVGNIILLVPVGFLMPLVFPAMTWKRSLAFGVIACLAIEVAQVVLRVGIFDIDDVILNTIGVMVGYWIYCVLAAMFNSPTYRNVAIGLIAAVAFVSGYAVFVNPKISLSPAPIVTEQDTNAEQKDLCGGTNGTGEIVRVGGSTFTLRQNNGAEIEVSLRMPDGVKTSAGSIFMSDLHAGDRVTLVGDRNADDTFIADAVLVCAAK